MAGVDFSKVPIGAHLAAIIICLLCFLVFVKVLKSIKSFIVSVIIIAVLLFWVLPNFIY